MTQRSPKAVCLYIQLLERCTILQLLLHTLPQQSLRNSSTTDGKGERKQLTMSVLIRDAAADYKAHTGHGRQEKTCWSKLNNLILTLQNMKHGIYVAVCSLFSVLAPHRYINPHKAPAYWQESEKSQKHTARLKTGQQRQATECKGRKSSSQKNKEIQEFNFSKTWPGTTQVQ